MRIRIAEMRNMFVSELSSRGIGDRFRHVAQQCGMFSFSGLTESEVMELREKFGIYTIKNGRICLAAMNSDNMARIVDAVAAIVK